MATICYRWLFWSERNIINSNHIDNTCYYVKINEILETYQKASEEERVVIAKEVTSFVLTELNQVIDDAEASIKVFLIAISAFIWQMALLIKRNIGSLIIILELKYPSMIFLKLWSVA